MAVYHSFFYLTTATGHNETYCYNTIHTLYKFQKYYALASEAGTFPGRDPIYRVRAGKGGQMWARPGVGPTFPHPWDAINRVPTPRPDADAKP
jgi:hypothetical protein